MSPAPRRGGRGRPVRLRPVAVLVALVAAGSGVIGSATPAGAATFDITTTADGGAGSLRAAFEAASASGASDVINLQAGATYVVCQALTHGDPGRTLTVNGNGATIRRSCPAGTINNSGAVNNWNGSTLVLRDLTIRGGRGPGTGAIGSISGTGNELYLDGVTVVDNQGTLAGAGIRASGYVDVRDSRIEDNVSGGAGGGIYLQGPYPTSGDALTVADSVVAGNRSSSGGGGIALLGAASTSILSSDISGNRTDVTSSANGGGIAVGGDLTVFWSTISGNRSGAPGGGVWAAGDLAMFSSTVSSNLKTAGAAVEPGGVIASGDVNLSFSTILSNPSFNLRIDNGGDLAVFGNVIGGAGVNCWFTGTPGAVDSDGYNVEDDDTCGFGAGPGDREDVADLGLLPLADNGGSGPTHHPTWTGGLVDVIPAANAACASVLFGFDQRSVNRPVGAGCEPGAVEVAFGPGLLPAHPYSDVPTWVEDAVRWIAYVGVAEGYADGTYRPNLDISRAQVVRMLHRMAGSPGVSALPPHGMSDVPPWIQDAVRWAVHDPAGSALPVMSGYPDATFRPDLPISRGQVVRSLYRLAGAPNVQSYPPHGLVDVPLWLEEAVTWAVRDPAGSALPVMTGYEDATFRPDLDITRAQVTRALHRLFLLP